MEFITNANVVYLMMMLGFLLVFLALLAPGTGVVEIGAIAMLVVAGYGLANLPLNYWAVALLPASVVLFILAIRLRRRRLFLILSLLTLLGGSIFIIQGEGSLPAVDPLLALVMSGLTFGLIWYVATKGMEAIRRTPDHSLERLIGKQGIAETDVFQEGTVQVAGEGWTARSEVYIPAGSQVTVTGREGLVLIVRPTANRHD